MAPTAPSAHLALTQACGLVDRSERGKLALTGPEAAGLLTGQVTNDVEALEEGHGCYAALLTNKGKMLGDLRVLRIGGDHPELHLDCERVALQALFDQLRRAGIGWQAELHKRTVQEALLSLVGPASCEVVAAARAQAAHARPALAEAAGTTAVAGSNATTVAGPAGPTAVAEPAGGPGGLELPQEEHAHVAIDLGVPARAVVTDLGVDVLCVADDAERVREALLGAGAQLVDEADAEVVRVAAGRPRYGTDLDEGVIPQEAGLNPRAVSFTKGCYVGQETVARLHWRGKPNRHLRGLRLDGPSAPGAALTSAEGKAVGALSSPVEHPDLGWIALALVRREVEPGATVAVGIVGAVDAVDAGGGDEAAGATATVVALPFT